MTRSRVGFVLAFTFLLASTRLRSSSELFESLLRVRTQSKRLCQFHGLTSRRHCCRTASRTSVAPDEDVHESGHSHRPRGP